MPALNELPQIGVEARTLPPGALRRRVWAYPAVRSHAAIVLTATRLYLVPGTAPPKPEMLLAVENGADPVDVFGSLVTSIDLGTVRKARHDLLENTIHLDARAGSGTGGNWATRVTVVFGQAEAADAAFARLWRRLGDDFKLRPDRPPREVLVRAPLAVLAGILVATGLLSFGANAAADVGSSGWYSFLRGMDWRVIAVLGGAAAAFVQVWLYRRLTQPPSRLDLVKPD